MKFFAWMMGIILAFCVTITKYHTLGVLQTVESYFSQGPGKSKTKEPADLMSAEDSILVNRCASDCNLIG